jgi:DNA repair exonuclease SbcCD nuclease subunit
MKVAIITDQHFGARNDSVNFIEFFEKFYSNVFFPTLEKEKINTVLILGDTFDRRKYINFYSLQRAKEMFFDKLAEKNIKVYMLAGNHDTYFKNTNNTNSVDLLLKEYNNIVVIDKPAHIYLNEYHFICMIPWICTDNYDDCLKFIENSQSEICCGHFEIQGFAMYKGMHSEEGLKRELFNKFSYTFSGHYHHKSSDGNIHYLGNPYELTWQDYNDNRGFHIFNLDNYSLSFIENPYKMFYRIVYDDKNKDINQIAKQDLTEYEGKYVKVIVANKTNPYLFDVFVNNLYEAGPLDVNIVEDQQDLTEGVDDAIINQAEDTLTILNNYVDNIKEDSIDNNKLKNILKELYVEALNLEQA